MNKLLLQGLGFGLLGFGVNALPLVTPYGPHYIFGGIFPLIAALMCGWRTGVVAALIASSYTVLFWHHPLAALIFVVEVACCGMAVAFYRQRGGLLSSLVITNALFWLVLGMPLGWLLYGSALALPDDTLRLMLLKQAVNGVCNAALAEAMAYLLVPALARRFRWSIPEQSWSSRDLLVAAVSGFTLLTMIIVLTITSRELLNTQLDVLRGELERDAAMLVERYRAGADNCTSMGGQSDYDAGFVCGSVAHTRRYALYQGEQLLRASQPPPSAGLRDALPDDGVVGPLDNRAILTRWGESEQVVRLDDRDRNFTVLVGQSLAPLLDVVRRHDAHTLLLTALLQLLVIGLSVLFSNYVTRPVRALAQTARQRVNPFLTPDGLQAELHYSGFQTTEAREVRAAVLDATRREILAYEQIKTVADSYRDVIAKAGAPIIVMDQQGIVSQWNEAAEKMTGVCAQDAVGEPILTNIRSGLSPEQLTDVISRALAGERVHDIELHIESVAGKRFSILASAILLRTPSGEPDQIVSVAQDMTSFMESQRQLLQASKMATLGEMAAGMAHELNQPLNVIRMSLQNAKRQLQRGNVDVDRLGDKLERIDVQVSRSAKLIDHLRLFGRKSSETNEPFMLQPVIDQVRDMYEEQLALANIKLEVDCDFDGAKVEGEPTLFEQVFLNLIANARDAVKGHFGRDSGGIIRLQGALAEGGRCYITVSDNGGGVNPQIIEHMFEPFFTTKEPGKGTGLGLSVSFGTIRDMGGTIEAQNIDDGLCVTIRLPILEHLA